MDEQRPIITVQGHPMPKCPQCGMALIEGGGFILSCPSLIARCTCGAEVELAHPVAPRQDA